MDAVAGDLIYSAADSSYWNRILSTPQQIIGKGFLLLRSRWMRLEVISSTPQQIQAIGIEFHLLRSRLKRLERDFVYSEAD
jgi:hypothetical protein